MLSDITIIFEKSSSLKSRAIKNSLILKMLPFYYLPDFALKRNNQNKFRGTNIKKAPSTNADSALRFLAKISKNVKIIQITDFLFKLKLDKRLVN